MTNESKITLHAGAAHFLTHFYEMAFPALAIPLVVSLDMDLPDVLKLGFFMYLLYGIGALPAGLVADRLGNHRILVIFFWGVGAGSVAMALSSTPAAMTLSLALIGIFASVYHPAGMGLISGCIRNRGTALGINGVAGNAGFVVAPFAAGLMNWIAGWQIFYLAVGLLSLGWGLLLAWTAIDETPVHGDPSPSKNGCGANDNLKYFVLLCIIMTLAGLAYRSNTVVLPAYLEIKADFLWNFLDSLHISHLSGAQNLAATFLTSAIFAIGMFGQLAGGKLADRYDLRKLYFLFHLAGLPLVLLMGVVTQQWLLMAAGAYVFFSLGMQPIENSLVAAFTPSRWRSTAYGVKFILTFGVGSFAVYLAGWIAKTRDLAAVYFFMGGIITTFLLLIVILMKISAGIEKVVNTEAP